MKLRFYLVQLDFDSAKHCAVSATMIPSSGFASHLYISHKARVKSHYSRSEGRLQVNPFFQNSYYSTKEYLVLEFFYCLFISVLLYSLPSYQILRSEGRIYEIVRNQDPLNERCFVREPS